MDALSKAVARLAAQAQGDPGARFVSFEPDGVKLVREPGKGLDSPDALEAFRNMVRREFDLGQRAFGARSVDGLPLATLVVRNVLNGIGPHLSYQDFINITMGVVRVSECAPSTVGVDVVRMLGTLRPSATPQEPPDEAADATPSTEDPAGAEEFREHVSGSGDIDELIAVTRAQDRSISFNRRIAACIVSLSHRGVDPGLEDHHDLASVDAAQVLSVLKRATDSESLLLPCEIESVILALRTNAALVDAAIEFLDWADLHLAVGEPVCDACGLNSAKAMVLLQCPDRALMQIVASESQLDDLLNGVHGMLAWLGVVSRSRSALQADFDHVAAAQDTHEQVERNFAVLRASALRFICAPEGKAVRAEVERKLTLLARTTAREVLLLQLMEGQGHAQEVQEGQEGQQGEKGIAQVEMADDEATLDVLDRHVPSDWVAHVKVDLVEQLGPRSVGWQGFVPQLPPPAEEAGEGERRQAPPHAPVRDGGGNRTRTTPARRPDQKPGKSRTNAEKRNAARAAQRKRDVEAARAAGMARQEKAERIAQGRARAAAEEAAGREPSRSGRDVNDTGHHHPKQRWRKRAVVEKWSDALRPRAGRRTRQQKAARAEERQAAARAERVASRHT